MTGASLLIAAVAFLIFSTTHATANSNHMSESIVANGYPEGEYVYFISNGYIYRVKKGFFAAAFKYNLSAWDWAVSTGGKITNAPFDYNQVK